MRLTKRPVEVMHRLQHLPEPLQRTGETPTQIERTHSGGATKRVNADTMLGERDVAKGTNDAAQRSSKRMKLRADTV